jgi:hypothetical protein
LSEDFQNLVEPVASGTEQKATVLQHELMGYIEDGLANRNLALEYVVDSGTYISI